LPWSELAQSGFSTNGTTKKFLKNQSWKFTQWAYWMVGPMPRERRVRGENQSCSTPFSGKGKENHFIFNQRLQAKVPWLLWRRLFCAKSPSAQSGRALPMPTLFTCWLQCVPCPDPKNGPISYLFGFQAQFFRRSHFLELTYQRVSTTLIECNQTLLSEGLRHYRIKYATQQEHKLWDFMHSIIWSNVYIVGTFHRWNIPTCVLPCHHLVLH